MLGSIKLSNVAHFQRLALLLSLVQGNSVTNADVNIKWTKRDVQNDDKWWLVRLSEVFPSRIDPQK